MADAVIGKAYLQVTPKMDKSALSSLGDSAGRDAGGRIGDGIGEGISAKSVAIGGVISNVLTSAVGKVIDVGGDIANGIYDGFAQNEQLVGGMKKLYGDSADTVIANANKAFMSAGKSANDYMESVTSISASLVKSTGGDTAKAAELANTAMVAMSDNVNTFGTDAASVENAFMGMAKGNYSMLDNLSLGFAGTQQGMVDLINASGVLDHELTKTSDLADVGFGTMVEAVQKVQENMGIAGTTAKEAMGTMEGSVTAAKSAWDNVLTSIGSGDSEQLASAASGLVDAMFGAIDSETGAREGGVIANFSRLVGNAFTTIGGMIPGLAQQALALLPESISGPIQSIVDNIAPLIGPAADMLKNGLGNAFKAVAPIVQRAVTTVVSVLANVVDFITTNILPIAQRVYDIVAPVIADILSAVVDAFPAIQQTIEDVMGAVGSLIEDVWPDIAAVIDVALDVISSAIDAAKPVVQSIADRMADAMGRVKGVVETVWPVVANLVKRGVKVIRSAVENFGPMVSRVKATFNRVKEAITNPIQTARDLIKSAIDRIGGIVRGVNLRLPHISLPHFSVSGGKAPWGIGGKGSMPSFSVSWYAKGGYFDQPTLFAGVGERGGEFVWPSYAPYLDRYADALASRMGGTDGVNVYLTYNGSGDADELVSTLTRELRMMRMTGAI